MTELPPLPEAIAFDVVPPLPSAPPVPVIMSSLCASSLVLHASIDHSPNPTTHPSFATLMQHGVAPMLSAPDIRARRSEHHVVPFGIELQ